MRRSLRGLTVVGSLLLVSACGANKSDVSTSDSPPAAPTTVAATTVAPATTAAPAAAVTTAAPAAAPATAATTAAPAVTTAAPAVTAAPAAPFENPLPQLIVKDVVANADFELSSLLPADKPVLLWFWAPH